MQEDQTTKAGISSEPLGVWRPHALHSKAGLTAASMVCLRSPNSELFSRYAHFLCSVELQVASGGQGPCGSVCCCKAACLGELCVLDVHIFTILGFSFGRPLRLGCTHFLDFGVL